MTLLTLSLNASAQVVQPTVVQRVEPTYASTANYVADPAVVKLVIDEHGDLFSLQSATSLPDNVVQALSKWKFRPGTQNGKPVAFTVPIALSIRRSADEMVKLTSRPSLTDDGPWPAAVQEGLKLTPENAAKLERKLKDTPDSAPSRAALITYASRKIEIEKAAKQLQVQQISWFVLLQPDAAPLANPAVMLFTAPGPSQNIEGYEQIKSLWLKQLSEKPDNEVIIGHATYFLRLSDPELTERLLLRALPKLGGAAVWLGELYGLSALGVKKLDAVSGLPTETSAILPDAGFGMRARSLLASTNDTRVVLAALQTVSEAGRSLKAASKIPLGYSEWCQELLGHAKGLYAEATASCDGSPIQAETSREPLRIAKRSAPAYPLEAKSRGIEGKVLFKTLIGKDGKMKLVEFLSGPLVFYESARSAVSRWEYQPPQRDGEPAEVVGQIAVNYKLN